MQIYTCHHFNKCSCWYQQYLKGEFKTSPIAFLPVWKKCGCKYCRPCFISAEPKNFFFITFLADRTYLPDYYKIVFCDCGPLLKDEMIKDNGLKPNAKRFFSKSASVTRARENVHCIIIFIKKNLGSFIHCLIHLLHSILVF